MTYADAEVTEAFHKVVAEKGEDYVYQAGLSTQHKTGVKMTYSYDDCVVGCVIRELNPEVHAEILEWEAVNKSSFPWGDTRVGPFAARRLFTQKQSEALRNAQTDQDARHTWGEAQATFDRTMNQEA